MIDAPEVIDAVPEGGRVRFIVADEYAGGSRAYAIAGATGAQISPVTPRFEDGFMALLHQATPTGGRSSRPIKLERRLRTQTNEVVVEVRQLVRRFGDFTAVDQVDFAVRGGEIFGLLGPNGAGKTTTFRMLCGLLAATSGTLRVAGVDLRTARASARQRIGYVAQKFSLYGQLTVRENLEFFASAYALRGSKKLRRIDWAMQQFELSPFATTASEQLPGGFKRRLAMAAALLHEPETLFLDEPTSGADPAARREFWRGISGLAEQGVTVVVTTHFMEEAEYCDHVAILDQGKVLARGTPAQLRSHGLQVGEAESGMEEAFIRIVESSRERQPTHTTPAGETA
jgi:ABC-2 type transport system ATP-binding protein